MRINLGSRTGGPSRRGTVGRLGENQRGGSGRRSRAHVARPTSGQFSLRLPLRLGRHRSQREERFEDCVPHAVHRALEPVDEFMHPPLQNLIDVGVVEFVPQAAELLLSPVLEGAMFPPRDGQQRFLGPRR